MMIDPNLNPLLYTVFLLISGIIAVWKLLDMSYKKRIEECNRNKDEVITTMKEIIVAKDKELDYYKESLRRCEEEAEVLHRERYTLMDEVRKALGGTTDVLAHLGPILDKFYKR